MEISKQYNILNYFQREVFLKVNLKLNKNIISRKYITEKIKSFKPRWFKKKRTEAQNELSGSF